MIEGGEQFYSRVHVSRGGEGGREGGRGEGEREGGRKGLREGGRGEGEEGGSSDRGRGTILFKSSCDA